jgi:hypothetical protein
MTKISKGLYKNVTQNDVYLASAYYPILVKLAKEKKILTYSDLVEKAKTEHPSDAVVMKAIAISTGRKLDVVRIFTTESDLPDLTSLIISKASITGESSGIPGKRYPGDPKKSKDEVFAYDWSTVSDDFDVYVTETVKIITPRTRRTKDEAASLRHAFYKENERSLPIWSGKDKEFIRVIIDELLMEGFSPEEAFPLAVQELERGLYGTL